MTHPPLWCGLLWVLYKRWACVLGLAASRPCLLSYLGCSHRLHFQSCTDLGGSLCRKQMVILIQRKVQLQLVMILHLNQQQVQNQL